MKRRSPILLPVARLKERHRAWRREREGKRDRLVLITEAAAPSLPCAAATVRVKGGEGEAAEAELVFVSETRRKEESAVSRVSPLVCVHCERLHPCKPPPHPPGL
ncbi:hypothetical protein NQZ68_000019 [Dissostichus eleginoides]|nr:hypothetical protein NQZ68_000019 [Dissostichus eleginoides]